MASPNSPAPRRKATTTLGAHVAAVLGPALAARGLSETGLVAHWPEIVGLDIARFARFERLNWPPRGAKSDPDAPRPPGVLVLRIDGAFALEAQYLSRLIIERVNRHFGWRCVEKVAFRQGPLPQPTFQRPYSPPSEEARAQARASLTGVEDTGLRDALERLGARIFERGGSRIDIAGGAR